MDLPGSRSHVPRNSTVLVDVKAALLLFVHDWLIRAFKVAAGTEKAGRARCGNRVPDR